ncbi:DegT/DnrJ/EryC1/StrS family aminotransferase [Catenovulum agarivorans]|uniref:DegT/DnrJ/EryC1/StrS family aminotransferase n=1 Tax=Catenovulum agarivorans TaxID=1172192 RepID=UPI0002F569C1|nr:DegT/DnrJ/EryC1/StrS family aminotransferase [Catenovulum agarivorans]
MIPVCKPYLPNRTKLDAYIDSIYQSCWLTNNGPLHQQLERRLKDYLGVEHLLLVANGTLAIQIALKALNITKAVHTTPFSFVATSSAVAWEGADCVYTDICPKSWNLDPNALAASEQTKGLLATHVFGNPCKTHDIERFAKEHSVRTVYDGAHAFGSKLSSSENLWLAGDASIGSLHATKLFHSVEGGFIVFKQSEHYELAKQLINFGIGQNHVPQHVGINAKMSEFHAAAGLAVLDDIDEILADRQRVYFRYKEQLCKYLQFQDISAGVQYNAAYVPVVFPSEEVLLKVSNALSNKQVFARRYFYPSLNSLNFFSSTDYQCPNSESISTRVLCLPTYFGLEDSDIDAICQTIISTIE